MIIGLDFDNTLICYDSVFREIATEYGISIPPNCSNPKKELQSEIRKRSNGEVVWTEIQATAYGPKLRNAKPFPGLLEKLEEWQRLGHQLRIISHKTRYPTLGHPYDLRAEASEWIARHLQSFFAPPRQVFFESTQQEKLSRIASQKCDVFIDDLPEIINATDFPQHCVGILFSPDNSKARGSYSSWWQIQIPPRNSPALVQRDSLPPERGLTESLPQPYSGAPFTQSKLQGGKNSEVYVLKFEDLPDLILKKYPNDHRSRAERESNFLRYLELIPEAKVPQLVSSSPQAKQCLMSKLEGKSFNPSESVEAAHWDECLTFIHLLQSQRDSTEAKTLHPAADSAFSLQAQLGITTRRRNQMAERATDKNSDVIARWIRGELESVYQEIARTLIGNPRFKRPIAPSEKIISPSDFGLHNAILQINGTVAFFDFEYAGWDDPAKTWSDFFLQPRFPAPRQLSSLALEKMSSHLEKHERTDLAQRLPLVFACCCLNWIYIILNHRWKEAMSTDEVESLKNMLSCRASEALLAIREPKQFCENSL